LDDSDEDDDEAEGAEDLEHIILCLYDKVCSILLSHAEKQN
jgi:transcription initiation factor TFIIA large subunit